MTHIKVFLAAGEPVLSPGFNFFLHLLSFLRAVPRSELLEGPAAVIKIIGGARTPILTVISKILTLQYLDFKIIGGATAPLAPAG